MQEKKTKTEITKIIIKSLLISGGIVIACTNPTFGHRILPKLLKHVSYKMKNKKRDQKKFYDTFTRLKNKGLIEVKYRGKQIHIVLSKEGKKYAGKYQIDELEIKKPKKWDKRWRLLIFDIENRQRAKREALRGKIIELGLYQLQKSVWVHPYDFRKEVETLKGFFGLIHGEIQMIVASDVGNESILRKYFSIK